MNRWKISTLVMIALFGVVVGGSHVKLASAEPQPHMEAALRHLGEARDELKAAAADKGGHRAKALDFTERAIKQVEDGIAFANKHDKK